MKAEWIMTVGEYSMGFKVPTSREKIGDPFEKYSKRAQTNRRKGKPRASRQGDQRASTTEPHRIPNIEVHPTKTASKAQNQELLKQTKKVT